MEQYILKSALKAELEKLMHEANQEADIASTGECFDEKIADAKYQLCKQIRDSIDSLKETIIDSFEVKEIDIPINDSRKANHVKFIKELKQKIDYYERELSKSGDSTKCDDVDWVTLASDMFDMLQKCLKNYTG